MVARRLPPYSGGPDPYGRCCAAALLGLRPTHAEAVVQPEHLVGDVGGALYNTQSLVRGKRNDTVLLPYGYFE